MQQNSSGVSVIVTTYNWPLALDRVLAHLLVQHVANMEIIVADDGSGPLTKVVIESWRRQTSVPIIHVWQEDKGFRAAKIRNKAVAQCQFDYLLFIDGDCLTLPNFICRHIGLQEKSHFVAGNRVLMSKKYTETVLNSNILLNNKLIPWIWNRCLRRCNRFLPVVALPLGRLRNTQGMRWHGVKTCNLGVWREDFMQVNGFNEAYEGWGLEDSDLAIRLIKAGIKHKSGKFSAPVIHCYHKEQSRADVSRNYLRLQEVIQQDAYVAQQGVAQYIGS